MTPTPKLTIEIDLPSEEEQNRHSIKDEEQLKKNWDKNEEKRIRNIRNRLKEEFSQIDWENPEEEIEDLLEVTDPLFHHLFLFHIFDYTNNIIANNPNPQESKLYDKIIKFADCYLAKTKVQTALSSNIDYPEPSLNQTLLHLAALNHMDVFTAFLISKGADVHAKDHNGNTPLHLAAFAVSIFGNDSNYCPEGMKIIKLLTQNGANDNLTNNQRIKPEQLLFFAPEFLEVKYLNKVSNLFNDAILNGKNARAALNTKPITKVENPKGFGFESCCLCQ